MTGMRGVAGMTSVMTWSGTRPAGFTGRKVVKTQR
jgi:hypothetical protein